MYSWCTRKGLVYKTARRWPPVRTKSINIMAGIIKRSNMWYATWRENGSPTPIRRKTGIRVDEPNMTARQAREMARNIAQEMEATAKGDTACKRAVEAVRAAAVARGAAEKIPSLREYLAGVPRTAGAKTENTRARAFRLFCDFLGARADSGVDTITPADCTAYVRHLLGLVSKGTAGIYKSYLSAAFRRAVDVDGLLDRNPMAGVNLGREAVSVNPDRGADKQKRLPFTLAEIRLMIDTFPAPWRDMVAVSWYGYGLRLSDVCLLRWESVKWEAGYLHIVETKTRKERMIPMLPPLVACLERLRAQAGADEYVFPHMAQYYNRGGESYVSTQFTALLRAHGIIEPAAAVRKEGERRHHVSRKSFHSIRHSVVSCLRGDAALSVDVVRDAVGHDSEAVERGYFTASMDMRRRAGAPLMQAAGDTPAPAAPALPPYPATA